MSKVFNVLLVLIIFITSCTLVIEEDLSNIVIEIIAPRNDAVSSDNSQQFIWEPVEFALEYKLQIAKPNFSLIDKLVQDSIVSGTKITFNLPPGQYEWRLKALNGSSETIYFTRKLTVQDTSNLNGSEVFLKFPLPTGYINSVNPNFSWDAVPNAEEYNFKIYDGDFENSSLITNEIRTQNTNVLLPIALSEKSYSWGVRAENELSKTLYSTRTFLVDITNPATPILVAPTANIISPPGDVIFTWSSTSTNASPEFDTVYIANDSNLNVLVVKAESLSSTYTGSLTQGTYFWGVKRFDKAGNSSWVSEFRKLIVQ